MNAAGIRTVGEIGHERMKPWLCVRSIDGKHRLLHHIGPREQGFSQRSQSLPKDLCRKCERGSRKSSRVVRCHLL